MALAVGGPQRLVADGHTPAAMTKKALDDHLADFGSGSVDAIVANYAPDAVITRRAASSGGTMTSAPCSKACAGIR